MEFTVLCVDDDPNVTGLLEEILRSDGCGAATACDGESALRTLEQQSIHAAVIDLRMPRMNGLDLLKEIKSRAPAVEVIILTGHGDIPTAVDAIKQGAHDFMEKPINVDHLRHRLRNLRQRFLLTEENRTLRAQLREKFHPENLAGVSAPMRKIYETIGRLRDDECVVLLQGESGTGKEQIARAVHFSGRRSGELFMPVDCAAINPNLFESELFGHAKGAFTGAARSTAGLVAAAGKGTLFLDEIGEIPPHLQAKFLRLLQEREYRPVGSDETRRLEARVIAATNKDLEKETRAGRFREDLYYRLNVAVIRVPPLRERPEDIPYLVAHFLKQLTSERRPVKDVTPEALKILMDYPWPGNARELENCLAQAAALGAEGGVIDLNDLPLHLRQPRRRRGNIEEAEREAILEALENAAGNKRMAARTLGISATTLYKKIRDYAISPARGER